MKNQNNKRRILYLLIAVAVLSGNPVLIAAALVVLILEWISRQAVSEKTGRIDQTVAAPEQGKKNETIRVEYSVTSEKRTAAGIRGEIRMQNLLTGNQNTTKVKFALLPAGASKTALELTEARCGVVRAEVRNAEVRDFLGVEKRKLPAPNARDILILPDPVEAELPEVFRRRVDAAQEAGAASREPDPVETDGTRPYREGDRAAQIHWNASARTDDPDDTVVRAEVPIPAHQAVILFDNALPQGIAIPPDRKSRLAERCFSLSAALLEENITHTILWVGEGGRLEHREIRAEEDRVDAMRAVLSCGFRSDGVTGADLFREQMGAALDTIDLAEVSFREKSV